jgi:hypothetical protein
MCSRPDRRFPARWQYPISNTQRGIRSNTSTQYLSTIKAGHDVDPKKTGDNMRYPGFASESWFGLSAPAKTPPKVVERLHQATIKAMANPDLRQKLEVVGFVVVGNSPAEFSSFVDAEIQKPGKAAKNSGARMD